MKYISLLFCCISFLSWSQRGVIHYSRENGLISNNVNDVTYDQQGFLWIATLSGIDRFDGQRFIHFQNDFNNPSSICSNRVLKIVYDLKGFVWATTENGGLIRISTKTLRVNNFFQGKSEKHTVSDNFGTALFVDDNAQFWYAPKYRGLDAYNSKTHQFKNFKPSSQLDGSLGREINFLHAIHSDRLNTQLFWCASKKGLLSFEKKSKKWRHFPVSEKHLIDASTFVPEANTMLCIEQDGKGNLYIGTEGGGLLYFDQFQQVYRRFELPIFNKKSKQQQTISALKWRDTRYIYACINQDEFVLFDTKTKVFIRYEEAERTILNPTRIARFGGQIAVAGSTSGLYIHNESLIFGERIRVDYCIDNSTDNSHSKDLDFSIHNYQIPKSLAHLKELRFATFCTYKNWLLAGSEEGIVAIHKTTKKVIIPPFAKLLPRDQIRALCLDSENRLWVGTLANGIYVIDLQKQRSVQHITDEMGLQSMQVNQLVRDVRNKIWVLNPNCVAIIDEKKFSIQSLEKQHGMDDVLEILVNRHSIYFIQSNGYIKSSVDAVLPPINTPIPYIQRVRELKEIPVTSNKHSFQYDNNNLAFEFGVLDYSNSTNNVVSYRLKGLESNWHSGNGKDEATYYNLPGGSYRFQVKILEDGRTRLSEYTFSVIPPFWLSWWFLGFCALLLGVSIWWYVGIRIQRVKSTEKLKTEFNRQINEMESKALRAQMNPHFLFNSLNSIRLFILKNEVENASDYIAKFSKLLRMILNHSRQDTITVYDEIQSLKLYLEFERLRFDKGFEFEIQIDGQELLDCRLPPMIIQPFIENAIWHGLMARMDDKGSIRVSFTKEPNRLSVTVEDNGIGREKAREMKKKTALKEGSVGLQITKERLRTLSQRTQSLNDFEIIDLLDENGKGRGTLIHLQFEIKHEFATAEN